MYVRDIFKFYFIFFLEGQDMRSFEHNINNFYCLFEIYLEILEKVGKKLLH